MNIITKSPFSEAAPLLVAKGYSVIPVAPGTKVPSVFNNNTWHPMKDWVHYSACVSRPSLIEEWSLWPNANIGVTLGAINGIIALDFDHDLEGAHSYIKARIPESPCVKIGARGETWFFKHSSEKSRKFSKNGQMVVELLCEGSQTVLPPSIHPDTKKPYHWVTKPLYEFSARDLPELPDDIIDILCDGVGVKRPSEIVPNTPLPDDMQCTLQDIEDALEYISSDNYDTWIRVGMGLKASFGNAAFESYDQWSARSKKYQGTQEIETKWNSFNKPDGVTAGSIVHLARENGWVWAPSHAEVTTLDITTKDSPLYYLMTGEQPIPSKPETTIYEQAPGLLGDLVGWYLDTSLYRYPKLAMAAALPVLGTLKAHKAKLILPGSDIRTNIMTVGMAPSGAGKNHYKNIASRTMKIAGMNGCLGGKPASGTGLLTRIENSHGRSLFVIDEFGQYLASLTDKRGMVNPVRREVMTYLMEMFTSADSTFLGPEYANQKERPRMELVQPCISLLGLTTQDDFFAAIGPHEVNSGFLGRFLPFDLSPFELESRRNPNITESAANMPSTLFEHVSYWHKQYTAPNAVLMLQNEVSPTAFQLSSNAHRILELKGDEWRDKVVHLHQNNNPLQAGLFIRLQEMALKIALLCHEPYKEDYIGVECAEFAIALMEEGIMPVYQEVASSIDSNEYEKYQKEVLTVIKNSPGGKISRTEMGKHFRGLKPKQLDEILEHLEANEEIERIVHKTGKVGRPTTFYRALV